MSVRYHFDLTFGALKRWFIAQCYDSLAVAILWLIALLILHVPWAPLWAILAALLQFIPHFGPILSLIGPAVSLAIVRPSWDSLLYIGISYAVIVVIDGLILQPYLMKRQNRVPIWASLVFPIVLGFVVPFWGVLLAPPLLAIIYAYRGRYREKAVRSGEGIVLPPERR
ncbi:MAG TPA: AI-2E family transporter [Terriglobales bacterium]|nr:AI-2E family transporter [Terriglobales bacterium]